MMLTKILCTLYIALQHRLFKANSLNPFHLNIFDFFYYITKLKFGREMRKKRTITIKDPRLRKVRNGLRSVLMLAEAAEEKKILNKKQKLYKVEGFWDESHINYKKLSREARKLNSQKGGLNHAFKASIVFCPVCQEIDKDMTYNPVSNKWFCTECYKFNQDFEIRQGRPELYP